VKTVVAREKMIEYGLSVSLESSPRTPLTPCAITTDNEYDNDLVAERCFAPRRKLSFARLMAEVESVDNDEVSISPRVLFSGIVEDSNSNSISNSRTMIRRNLTADFSSLSPVSFGSLSSSSVVKHTEQTEYIGECGVCYLQLPLRANHVFTLCGHLFCLRCLLKWWDNSTTCPLCRAELFTDDDTDADHHSAEQAEEAEQAEQAEEAEEAEEAEAERIWMRREFWNGRVDHFVDSDGEEHYNNNGGMPPLPTFGVTQINRYLHQDTHLDWTRNGSIHLDDTLLQHVNEVEIQGLQENRFIAMNLFARSIFCETLFDSSSMGFLGSVSEGEFVPKNDWVFIVHENRHLSQRMIMYEFVIRRGSVLSPLFEVNLFGFIKDVAIQQINGMMNHNDHDGNTYDFEWEENPEYVFIADVFTPSDFYIDANALRSYGGYNMEEGTITTQELAIPFSQVRRLYLIRGHERS